MSKNLDTYIGHFKALHRGSSKYGRAPHKPILLLTLLEAFRREILNENRIFPDEDLVFLYHDIWKELVPPDTFVPNMHLPFFHLKNEEGRFWQLLAQPGEKLPKTSSGSVKSLPALQRFLAFAQLDDALFHCMMQPETNAILQRVILDTYFSGRQLQNYAEVSYTEMEQQMLNDPDGNYAIQRQGGEKTVIEEAWARQMGIVRVVKKLYDHTCAVSHYRLIHHGKSEQHLVQTCHIDAWSKSKNDAITNCIALTPGMHWAFDRGVIAVDDNYRLMVSNRIDENKVDFSLESLRNKEIHRPKEERHWPSLAALGRHRSRFGF